MVIVEEAERRARVVMSKVAEPGDPDVCRLVRDHSAGELLGRLRSGRRVDSPKVAAWAGRASTADYDDLARAADLVDARFVCPGDDEWPAALDDLVRLEGEAGDRRVGAPFGLWVRGAVSASALASRCVAIVGSRASTAYGEHMASALAFDCSRHGITVVSGGAYGIDAAAHRAVLSRQSATVAVLAGGIDRLYPVGNTQLLTQVLDSGLLVSEAAPGCAPTKSRFLVRNRIIAALSQGTVVVEAALRSGALNTARWARDLGRGVMGVPGPVTSVASGGVHELLRQPETLLVTDAPEIIEHISPAGEGLAPPKSGIVREIDLFSRTSRQVLDATPLSVPAQVHSIARTAGLVRDEVERELSLLRKAGLVVERTGGWTLAPP